MKKLLLTVLAALPALAFSQNAFIVKGKAGKISTPAKIFLNYTIESKTVTDSVTLKNGTFTFNGNINGAVQARLILDYKGVGFRNLDRKVKQDILVFYLASGTTIVTSTDSVAKAKITGSKINDESAQLKVLLKPYTDKRAALMADYKAASPEDQKSDVFMTKIRKRGIDIKSQENAVITRFIKAHPSSSLNLFILSSLFGPFPEYTELAPLYNNISASVKNTPAGKEMTARLEKLKPVALGAIAPEFAQADSNGKMISLSSFRGKYVLVHFWSTRMPVTRTDNAELVSVFNKYKDKKFTMFGVSIERQATKNDWLVAIRKDGLNWPQVTDFQDFRSKTVQLYSISAMPENFLLDPNGKIIAKNLRGKQLEDKMAELFGKKI